MDTEPVERKVCVVLNGAIESQAKQERSLVVIVSGFLNETVMEWGMIVQGVMMPA